MLYILQIQLQLLTFRVHWKYLEKYVLKTRRDFILTLTPNNDVVHYRKKIIELHAIPPYIMNKMLHSFVSKFDGFIFSFLILTKRYGNYDSFLVPEYRYLHILNSLFMKNNMY